MANISVIFANLEAFTGCCVVIYDSSYTERINVAKATSSFAVCVCFFFVVLFGKIVPEPVASKRYAIVAGKLRCVAIPCWDILPLSLKPSVRVPVRIGIENIVTSIWCAITGVVTVVKSVGVGQVIVVGARRRCSFTGCDGWDCGSEIVFSGGINGVGRHVDVWRRCWVVGRRVGCGAGIWSGTGV